MSRPDPVAELCAELAELRVQLLAAIAPERPRHGDPNGEPSLAAPILAATMTATAPRWSQTRKAYGSRPPVDLELVACEGAVVAAALELACRAREDLGDVTRDGTPDVALGNLPMLLGRLGKDHPVRVRALGAPAREGEAAREGVLSRLRRRARVALGLARRPLPLGECLADRQPYAASWVACEEDGEWVWVPDRMWEDGVCREYDADASRPDDDPPHFAWRPSVLYIRDSTAPEESEDAAVRCPGCHRVWRGRQGRAELYRLMRPELPPSGSWAVTVTPAPRDAEVSRA